MIPNPDPTMPIALALDVGSSSVRVTAYGADGHAQLAIGAYRHYAAATTADGGAEFDAPQLLTHILECMDEAVQRAGSTPIAAIGVDTFATNLIGLDSSGQPITPVYMWNDSRSRHYVAPFAANLTAHHYDRTGTPPHVSYWPPRFVWLAHEQPDVFRRAARWLSIGEWLTLKLFGVAQVSTSLAAWTGMIDRRSGDWAADLLDASGVRREQLSVVSDQPFGALTAEFAARWPSLQTTRWLPPIADGYAANVGCGAINPQRAALTMGTSGALRVLVSGNPEHLPEGLFCYKVNAHESLLGGALSNAGNVFGWLKETLTIVHDPFDTLAEPDGHGLTVLPFWAGERSPGWHDNAQAAILGMTLHTTPDDIARASLEAVVYQLAAIDETLSGMFDKPPALFAAGGVLAGSPAWAQVVADVLGRDVTLCADPQASARGSALLALASVSQVAGQALETVIEPIAQNVYRARPAFTERYAAARKRQGRAYDLLIKA